MELILDIEKMYDKEKAKLSKDVVTVISAKVRAKNLFGWRSYLEEVLENVLNYMINTEFMYSGGAYVAWGMQSALDSARYCSAKKRRADYEAVSLDGLFQVAENTEQRSNEAQILDLTLDVSLRFGESFAKELEPFLRGYETKLSKDVAKKLKSPEFVSWFKDYIKS